MHTQFLWHGMIIEPDRLPLSPGLSLPSSGEKKPHYLYPFTLSHSGYHYICLRRPLKQKFFIINAKWIDIESARARLHPICGVAGVCCLLMQGNQPTRHWTMMNIESAYPDNEYVHRSPYYHTGRDFGINHTTYLDLLCSRVRGSTGKKAVIINSDYNIPNYAPR